MKKVRLPICPTPVLNTCSHGRPVHLRTKKGIKSYLVCSRGRCVYEEANETLKLCKKIMETERKE